MRTWTPNLEPILLCPKPRIRAGRGSRVLCGAEVEEQPPSKGRTETECRQRLEGPKKRWDHLYDFNIN